MLDVLRKHASSWMIKVILGAIIISFAFFFGYNRMTRAKRSIQGLAPGEPVATVNGVEISDTEFRFFYDRSLDRLREAIKGEGMAEQMQKFAMSMTLNQMIQRQLLLQTAEQLGIKVTDDELASVIRKNPELIKDGQFDPIFYKHQYLPYFENRFGIDYEELVRQDLTIQALESMFQNVDGVSASTTEEQLWTFEVVSLKQEDKALAQSFLGANDWAALAKKTKADVKKVGPITMAERSKILAGRGTFEDYTKIFLLSSQRPVLNEPLELGDTIFLVRFVEQKSSPVAGSAKPSDRFFDSWMREAIAKAKIVTYLKDE